MSVSVFSFYSKSKEDLQSVETEAGFATGVLFTSTGDELIKVVSKESFESSSGTFVSKEEGRISKMDIKGMTCFRCVNAICEVVENLPVLAFDISLNDHEGTFVCREGVDVKGIAEVINAMGKFTATLQ